MERVERRLAAILAADVAGYSRLMSVDEKGTHERLKTHFRELINPKITMHGGRIVKNTGDGLLAEFPSAVNAVRCAVEIQRAMVDQNADAPKDKRISFRIGVNLGDVIVEPEDIFGDDVNIASRLEALAEPGGIWISRAVRDRIGERLPYSFDDIGEQSVKNIAHPVHVFRVRFEGETKPRPTGTPDIVAKSLLFPDKPSIAVLPFVNLSGDPEQEYFADGMVDEIITALSRIRWLLVVARNSSFTYKDQTVDVKQIGRELGVRYVLEGSVRKGGGRVRITAQLIESITGTHLWADRFDGSLEDIFELQDKVASSVAGVIEPTLQAAEIRRSADRPTRNLTAYDLYLRALAALFPITRERTLDALGLLEQAIVIDRHYGAFLRGVLSRATRERTLDRRAREIPPPGCRSRSASAPGGGADPGILANAAHVLAYFGENIGAMVGLVDRALALNPSFARGWNVSGTLRLWAGQPDIAIEHAETSLRLSPRERMGTPLFSIG